MEPSGPHNPAYFVTVFHFIFAEYLDYLDSISYKYLYITLCCDMHCFQMNQKTAPSGLYQSVHLRDDVDVSCQDE